MKRLLVSARPLMSATAFSGLAIVVFISGLLLAILPALAFTEPVETSLNSAALTAGKDIDSKTTKLNGPQPNALPLNGMQLGIRNDEAADAALSPGGRLLATGGPNGIVRIWDVSAGREIRSLRHGASIVALRFRSDDETLVVADANGGLSVWQATTGKRLMQRGAWGHPNLLGIALSSDGEMLVRVTEDGVHLNDVIDGTERLSISLNDVANAKLSSQGYLLAIGQRGGEVSLADTKTSQKIGTFQGLPTVPIALEISSDGKLLAAASWKQYRNPDRSIRLWNVQTGELLRRFTGHSNNTLALAFSPDGNVLASGGDVQDGAIRLWDIASGHALRTINGHLRGVRSLEFTRDGTTLLSVGHDHSVCLWEVDTGQERRWRGRAHTGAISALAFSPNGELLATADDDHAIHLWDVAARKWLRSFHGHHSRIGAMAFAPDGKTLASGAQSPDGTLRIWGISTGEHVVSAADNGNHVNAVAFAPDGMMIASPAGRTVRLSDARSGHLIARLRSTDDQGTDESVLWNRFADVAFSTDGTRLAAADDQGIVVWDVASKQEVRRVRHIEPGHGVRPSRQVRFLPDGSVVARVHKASLIRWNVDTGELVKRYPGARAMEGLSAFAVSPDLLVAEVAKGVLGIWDVASEELLRTFAAHDDTVRALAFSPSGATLASGGADSSVMLWNLPLAAEKPQRRK